jgi:hypothetical protein
MFKSISNLTNAVKDLASIAGKEVSHQLAKAVSATEGTTSLLAAKTGHLKEKYEANLNSRKNRNPEVVTEAPANVTPVN